jgi:hypothetical protein
MEFTTRLGLHSQTTRLQRKSVATTPGSHGPNTLTGRGPDQGDIDARTSPLADFPNTTVRRPHGRRFGAGLFPLHSPLLRESLLVSFPPLIDMLKFSGCSRLISGRSENNVCYTSARSALDVLLERARYRQQNRRRRSARERRVAVRGSIGNESDVAKFVCGRSILGAERAKLARASSMRKQELLRLMSNRP